METTQDKIICVAFDCLWLLSELIIANPKDWWILVETFIVSLSRGVFNFVE